MGLLDPVDQETMRRNMLLMALRSAGVIDPSMMNDPRMMQGLLGQPIMGTIPPVSGRPIPKQSNAVPTNLFNMTVRG